MTDTKPAHRHDHAERQNLRRLFTLRIITVICWGVLIYAVVAFLGMPIPATSMSLVLIALALFNVFTRLRLTWGGPVGQLEFLLQLMVDVLALSSLLYLSGGASNPFVLLFLLPIIIATAVLPATYVWILTLFTGLCYSLLMWKYVPLPHIHGEEHSFSQHVFGMWLAFVVSAAVIAYFVVGMRRSLRSKDQALAAAREKHLRDEQLIVLGTLAASTAHELGTPLGTMALLSEELRESIDDPQTQRLVHTLREQISRCKNALATLSASAGGVSLTGGGILPVKNFLHEVLEEWQQSRPSVHIHTDWQGPEPVPGILADRSLSQALCNILDNAADASPNEVEWQARWDVNGLSMDINDRGKGLSDQAEQLIGTQPYSEKGEGMGLGLFLAHSIITRFAGEVRLFNREGGGVTTRIRLPLSKTV
ncbi:ATP-binding protein [Sulfuriflexus mobilis]|uniref:ATP-binding protein n=1 Tax=Sulfuriflexus mobilis TaxID=1811807 RepID=UPI000F81F93F|nr:ATP-binding protein [Sulfuriflexus mobilis]